MALADQAADTNYRRDWGAAFKAVRALLADPNDTVQVFRIMGALNGASSRTGYQRLLKTTQGARIASGLFVLAATLKIFLYDMAGLEGLMRALSFIGLGLVLIGIGLLYQKLVFAQRPPAPAGGVAPDVV